MCFAIEQLIDQAARELGWDRLELHRNDLIREDQMAYTNAVGSQYELVNQLLGVSTALSLVTVSGSAVALCAGVTRACLAHPFQPERLNFRPGS